ncbi:hypothetical protein RB2150_16799 [Rhodobacterales bacterium HTCC2150]|nr:hypothetical protein RB2150_16799 [Rhodobacterales bacterium HTCC2150] [Rhodobacteraceae bacterium HTCC2150]
MVWHKAKSPQFLKGSWETMGLFCFMAGFVNYWRESLGFSWAFFERNC